MKRPPWLLLTLLLGCGHDRSTGPDQPPAVARVVYVSSDANVRLAALDAIKPMPASWQIFWQESFLPILTSGPGWTQQAFPRVPSGGFAPISEFHRRARTDDLPDFSFIEPSWTLEKGGRAGSACAWPTIGIAILLTGAQSAAVASEQAC